MGLGHWVAVLLLVVTSDNSKPKLPFADQGACPFECCQSGRWTARSTGKAFTRQRKNSQITFLVRPGEEVTALTGVVVTRKVGVVKMEKTTTFDVTVFKSGLQTKLTLTAGERLYTLHLAGEGMAVFWYKGTAYAGELYAEGVHKGDVNFPWDVLSVPETEWWVKLRNGNGIVGWILNPINFHGMDACGS
jgi:hypothetical protein